MIVAYGQSELMNRIRAVREGRGLTQEQLAALTRPKTSQQQLDRWEKDQRSLKIDWLQRIAVALEVPAVELFPELGEATPPQVDLVGYAGTHDLYSWGARTGPWGPIEKVEAPPGMTDVVALRVQGDGYLPRYEDGDLLYVRRHDGWDPESCDGRDCVVELDGGQTVIKKLERIEGGYRLTALGTGETITTDKIVWATPIVWVKRA
jgi:transcriptional regulator with XRE-family HTH domain